MRKIIILTLYIFIFIITSLNVFTAHVTVPRNVSNGSLIVHYTMDIPSGNIVDAQGVADGTSNSGITSYQVGGFDGGFAVSIGNDGFFRIGDTDGTAAAMEIIKALNGSDGFTIVAAYQEPDDAGPTDDIRIFTHVDSANSADYLTSIFQTGAVQVFDWDTANNNRHLSGDGANPADGEWVRIIFSFNATGGTAVYLNNTLGSECTTAACKEVMDWRVPSSAWIGDFNARGGEDFLIDDVCIFNVTLTAAQRAALTHNTCDSIIGVTVPPVGFTITVIDQYDGLAINNFTLILSNATHIFINTTTVGSINFDNITQGLYTVAINSTQDGGYFNLSFENINASSDYQAQIYQAILRINATEVITNITILNFNVSVSLQSNKSNSSGFSQLFLKAGNYNLSFDADGFMTGSTNFTIGNVQDNLLTIQMGTSNLTVTAFSSSGAINNFNSTIRLTSTGFTQTEETNTGKIVFPTVVGTYNVSLNATGFSFATQQITISSGNLFPNVTFNLFSENSINITIFDEQTNEIINYTTTTLIMDHVSQKFTNTTESGNVFFTALFDGLWNLLASTSIHAQREYIFTILPQSTSTLNVYLLNSSNGELKTFTVKNKQDQTLPDTTVSISNKINNSFVTVAQSVTDFAGQVNIFLSSSNEYRFTIEAAGFTTKVFDLVPIVQSYNIILDPTDSVIFTTIFDEISFTILPDSPELTPQQGQNFSIITSSPLGQISYFGLNSSFNSSTNRITNVSGSPAGGTASIFINTTEFNSTTIAVDFFIKVDGQEIINIHRDYRAAAFTTASNFSAVGFADKYTTEFSNVFKSIFIVILAIAVIISLAEMGSPAVINGMAGSIIIIGGAVVGWIPKTVAFIVGFIVIGMYFIRRGD